MANRNRPLAVLLTLGLTMASWGQSPIDILRASLESRKTTTASLIQAQTMMIGGEKTVMKIEYDGKGRSRRTMLQPLRLQGQVIIDDGKSLVTLLPDSQAVKVVASRSIATDIRLELIAKNYRLSAKGGEKVAGRDTTVVTCYPRHKEMPRRKITIDAASRIPLRVVSSYQGKDYVLIDTLSFDLPKTMPTSLFQSPSGYKQIRVASAVRVPDEREAAEMLPFQPWIPKSLPYGFAVESLEILPAGKASVLAIRLTDGFNMATVYQWDGSVAAKFPDSNSITSRNIGFVLVGDIPEAISDRITDYLTKEALAL